MNHARALALLVVMLVATSSASCFDPVHAREVEALGGEVNGVGPGRLHRPGQPCRVCHGGDGPGSPEFTFAGTVYLYRDEQEAAEKATVVISEAKPGGKSISLGTNEAGNFYVTKDEFDPEFPVLVEIRDARILEVPAGVKSMVTPIGRNGGCGFCHANNYAEADPKRLMPHLYLDRVRPSTP
jgi:hypothetical protein